MLGRESRSRPRSTGDGEGDEAQVEKCVFDHLTFVPMILFSSQTVFKDAHGTRAPASAPSLIRGPFRYRKYRIQMLQERIRIQLLRSGIPHGLGEV